MVGETRHDVGGTNDLFIELLSAPFPCVSGGKKTNQPGSSDIVKTNKQIIVGRLTVFFSFFYLEVSQIVDDAG